LERVISTSPITGSLSAAETTAKSLEDLLLLCIDEVLGDLLGTRAREAVYDHLERNYSLARTDIPKHTNKFLELLEETFGKGSKTIEKSIIKRIFDKLEWKFYDNPGYAFMDYLEAIRAGIAKALIEHAKSCSASK
jgi:hypothetical protein